ncbi:hypothetical protein AXG93_4295s1720 [Marchantia polymorpha subsp. ruderalis]|uniref:Uncharacterized protein n=1 Tax=Marchantia polymorpha subsp. ruderalis TaxID=1480154 RepID=A0A176WDL5_MARPO|nr:hypothetical protein AXG93_4295s1720 [Marchantia polymorpha subsp. ruderalis]
MTQANMKGSTDTRNLLQGCDCSQHEKGDSGGAQVHTSKSCSRYSSPPNAVAETQPKKASDKKGVSEMQSRAPSRNGRGSTPSPIQGHGIRTPTRNGRGTTPSPIQIRSATHSPASPDEFVVRKTPGAHIHLRSARPPGCDGESTQPTVNEVHNRIARRRGFDDHAHVSRETENIRPRSGNTPESERPRSSPPCNCGLRKCKHELSRDHGKDFAFMDGFETKEQPSTFSVRALVCLQEEATSFGTGDGMAIQELGIKLLSCHSIHAASLFGYAHDLSCRAPPEAATAAIPRHDNHCHRAESESWKPGKKVVDHFSDQPRSEYRWKSSRRSIPGADRMQSRTPEWRSDEPPISRKGTGGRDGGSAQVQREYDPFGNPLNNPEWEWHPGKGRGNGPMPGEWLPPFRAYSARAEAEPPPFLRGKGSGRRHSDEWLPPFRERGDSAASVRVCQQVPPKGYLTSQKIILLRGASGPRLEQDSEERAARSLLKSLNGVVSHFVWGAPRGRDLPPRSRPGAREEHDLTNHASISVHE